MMRSTNDTMRRFAFIVDLVGGVRRLVIIVVRAGPEEEHRHLFRVERRMIARAVAVFVERQRERSRCFKRRIDIGYHWLPLAP